LFQAWMLQPCVAAKQMHSRSDHTTQTQRLTSCYVLSSGTTFCHTRTEVQQQSSEIQCDPLMTAGCRSTSFPSARKKRRVQPARSGSRRGCAASTPSSSRARARRVQGSPLQTELPPPLSWRLTWRLCASAAPTLAAPSRPSPLPTSPPPQVRHCKIFLVWHVVCSRHWFALPA
jgi:hypothetical protein